MTLKVFLFALFQFEEDRCHTSHRSLPTILVQTRPSTHMSSQRNLGCQWISQDHIRSGKILEMAPEVSQNYFSGPKWQEISLFHRFSGNISEKNIQAKPNYQQDMTLNEINLIVCHIARNPVFRFSDQAQHSGLRQWLASRTTGQGVPGSRPNRGTVCCGIEQVTFTHCLVLVKPRKPWTDD